MNHKFSAKAKVHWLNAAHGGRKCPPVGPIYAATGRFEENGGELFSVVLRLSENGSEQAEIGFIAPELGVSKLAPGVRLFITEGFRTVAKCEIVEVIK